MSTIAKYADKSRDESPMARRQPGGWEGKVWMSEDFAAPLPDDILALFEGTVVRETKKR